MYNHAKNVGIIGILAYPKIKSLDAKIIRVLGSNLRSIKCIPLETAPTKVYIRNILFLCDFYTRDQQTNPFMSILYIL